MAIFASFQAFVSAYSLSDVFGKLIFLGLFFLSAVCWAVLIYKIWLAKKVQKNSLSFRKALEAHQGRLLEFDSDELMTRERNIPHPFADILQNLKTKARDLLNKNHYFVSQAGMHSQVYLSLADLESVESHVLTTISTETKVLEKNLFILSTIATLAPFLGLLGTVWGILVTFSGLQNGASASSNSAILGGLSTALVTTVLGLLIAIPALVSYNYLKTLTKTMSSDMEDFLYQLLSQVELQYRKTDSL